MSTTEKITLNAIESDIYNYIKNNEDGVTIIDIGNHLKNQKSIKWKY